MAAGLGAVALAAAAGSADFQPMVATPLTGTIHIFHEDSSDKISVVETVKTEFGAKTMGHDPKTHNLYVDTSDFGPAPAPTPQQPNPQPVAKPGTFRLLIYGPQASAKSN